MDGLRAFCPPKAPWKVEAHAELTAAGAGLPTETGIPVQPPGDQLTKHQKDLPSETRGFQVIEKSSWCHRFLHSLLIVSLLLAISGCHYRQDPGIHVPEGRVVFDRIAVLPFQQMIPEDQMAGAVRCPLCGTMFTAAKAAGGPEKVVESRFLELLEKGGARSGIIAGEHVSGVYRRVSAASFKAPLRRILCDAGKELGAEAIVIGYLYRYREREGEPFAVEKPASVAFEIHLIRVEDGVLVWRGVFDRTQSSIMEDLLQASFWKWITAEELAAAGLEQVMSTFPGMPPR